jgi:hypothetical protein
MVIMVVTIQFFSLTKVSSKAIESGRYRIVRNLNTCMVISNSRQKKSFIRTSFFNSPNDDTQKTEKSSI